MTDKTDGNGHGDPADFAQTVAALFKALTALAESQKNVLNMNQTVLDALFGLTRRVEELERSRRESN